MKVIELNEIREGQFVEELNQAIREGTSLAHANHAPVGIIVKLLIEPRQIGPQDAMVDGVNLFDTIEIKKPKPQPGQTTFYVGNDEVGPTLTRKNPANRSLPLAPVKNIRD